MGILAEASELLTDWGVFQRRAEGSAQQLGATEATASRKARADALVSGLEGQYRRGVVKVGFSPDIALTLATRGLGALGNLENFDNTDRAILGNLARAQGKLDTWRTKWRRWAEAGKRDDGSSYSWEKWESYERDLSGEIQLLTQEAWDSSNIVNALRWAAAPPPPPNQWPPWLKALIVGGCVVAGLTVVNTAANLTRAVRGT